MSLDPGLSPRVRGNLMSTPFDHVIDRSIPACTGEPSQQRPDRPTLTVYPRVYGGTTRTGKSATLLRVYPRVYGGTKTVAFHTMASLGLSPRVRGNRHHSRIHLVLLRSIPACTGEPKGRPKALPLKPVYPRVYGGTALGLASALACAGLSPRVRGNHILACGQVCACRSIPACTGEPLHRRVRRYRLPVYPRVYGGTLTLQRVTETHAGLSPRVRGNHRPARTRPTGQGSIPACTGEPMGSASTRPYLEVYPRVYGGTRTGPCTPGGR